MLLFDQKIQKVVYDEVDDLIVILGEYSGGATKVYIVNSFGIKIYEITVEDNIHTIAYENGYVCMGSKLQAFVYVYNTADKTLQTLDFIDSYIKDYYISDIARHV